MRAARLLYIDAVAGVAGDMLLGALLDAGAPLDGVRAGLEGLGVEGLRIEVQSVQRLGLAACAVQVADSGRATHDAVERSWAAVRDLIEQAGMPDRARARAQEAFRLLAHAEARVHGVSVERVHFHEVGAIDAIADVCGVALALELLGIDQVSCSPLPLGRGLTHAAHGPLPLPAPAVLELLRGAPVHGVEECDELVTPTGAALVAALAQGRFGPPAPMLLERTGAGAGTRELASRPNIVRVLVGSRLDASMGASVSAPSRPAVLLECTLDDLSGQLIADAAQACLAAGALDAWLVPVQMKKGRPGVVLSAIVRPELQAAVAEVMLRTTSSLGVRALPVARWELDREVRSVSVDGHTIAVKLGRLGGEIVNVAPEHDDVARAAAALGIPAKTIWARAWAAADAQISREV